MNDLEDVVAITSVFGSAVLVVFFVTKYTYLTRKAMYEKGITNTGNRNVLYLFDVAFTAIGVGVGLGFSAILPTLSMPEDSKDLLVSALILVFGGLGLFSGHFVRKRVGQ